MPPQHRGDTHPQPGGHQTELGVRLGGAVSDDRFDALGAQREHQPFVAELSLAPGDPLVVGELREVHLLAVREPVSGRHRHFGRVVQDVRLDQAVGQRHRLVVPVEHDREVEVAADHPGDAELGLQLRGADPQRRVLCAQGGERGGEQASCRRGERREPELADDLPPLGLQVGLGQFHLGQDARRVLGQQPARVREPHPPPVLGEELLSHLALQLGHLLRDGRRRDVQRLGRAAHRAVPGQGVEGAQALQVQHVSDTTRYRVRNLDCAT